LKRRFDIVDDRAVHAVDAGARLLDRHAGLEAREQIRPVALPVVEAFPPWGHQLAHGHRHEDLRLAPERGAAESTRRDPDDGQRLAVDDDRFVQYGGIAAKPRCPVPVAQHSHEVIADVPIVVRAEQPAERRLDAEHRKIRARYERALAVHRLAAIGEVGAEAHVRRDAGEHRLQAFEIAKHRVAEDHLARTSLRARCRAGLRSGSRQVDQLARPDHGQSPQQRLFEQRKHRRVGPYAKRQRYHGDDADERRFEEPAERKSQIQWCVS
jgi:hypothetical protein